MPLCHVVLLVHANLLKSDFVLLFTDFDILNSLVAETLQKSFFNHIWVVSREENGILIIDRNELLKIFRWFGKVYLLISLNLVVLIVFLLLLVFFFLLGVKLLSYLRMACLKLLDDFLLGWNRTLAPVMSYDFIH